ncbi:extracellular matrix protein 1-like [Podarcis muralis]
MAMKIQVLLLVSWFVLGQSLPGSVDMKQRPIQIPGRVRVEGGPEKFPPARPSARNIGNICKDGSQKLSQGLKGSDYSNVYDKANVLVDLGDALGKCCRQPEKEKLPCSQKAWSALLNKMCEKQGAVKMEQNECCLMVGAAKENCFDQKSRFPNYDFKN